jgi:hypothetical protein
MKKLNLTKTLLTGAVLALMTVGMVSCKKDSDPDRKKFLGTFSVTTGTIACGVTGNGTIAAGTSVTITENSGGDEKVNISIGGQLSVVATASGNTLTLDNQTVSGFTYTGTGTLNSNTLSLSINEYDASVPENCVYSLTANK